MKTRWFLSLFTQFVKEMGQLDEAHAGGMVLVCCVWDGECMEPGIVMSFFALNKNIGNDV